MCLEISLMLVLDTRGIGELALFFLALFCFFDFFFTFCHRCCFYCIHHLTVFNKLGIFLRQIFDIENEAYYNNETNDYKITKP